MKLVHVDLEKPIAIHRNCPTEWIIESPELFLKYVEQLQKQNQGEEGNFVLSKADTELNMKRDVELILTPFSLDFADHRIQIDGSSDRNRKRDGASGKINAIYQSYG